MPEVDGGKRIQMKDEVKIINVGKWRKRELRGRKKKYFPPKLPSRQERENTVTPQPFLHSRQETNLAVLIQPTCAFIFFSRPSHPAFFLLQKPAKWFPELNTFLK